MHPVPQGQADEKYDEDGEDNCDDDADDHVDAEVTDVGVVPAVVVHPSFADQVAMDTTAVAAGELAVATRCCECMRVKVSYMAKKKTQQILRQGRWFNICV